MDREQEIRALLSALSDDELALFETFYQRQLADALAEANAQARGSATGAADPVAVEADLVEELIEQAEGRDPHTHGTGFVPRPGGGVYELRPPTSNPLVARQGGDAGAMPHPRGLSPRQRLLASVAILGITTVLLLWSGRAGHDEGPASRQVPDPTANSAANSAAANDPAAGAPNGSPAGDPSTHGTVGPSPSPIADVRVRKAGVGYPTSLEIVPERSTAGATTPVSRTSTAIFRVVPSAGKLGGQWAPSLTAGTAAWLTGSYVNAVVCLPPDTEALLQELPRGTAILMRSATGDVRAYDVVRVRRVGRQQTEVMSQRKAGLTLIACGGSGNDRVVVESVYRPPISRRAPPVAAVGSEVPDYVRVRVEDIAITVVSANQVQVALTVHVENMSGAPLFWTDLNDELLIDGQAVRPLPRAEWPALEAGQRTTVTYKYLVPRSAVEALWRIIVPTGESADLRVALSTEQ